MSTLGKQLESLTLDSYGRVILTDDYLKGIEECRLTTSAGANSLTCDGTTNSICSNTYNCNNSSNNASCTNSWWCEGSANQRCKREVEMDLNG